MIRKSTLKVAHLAQILTKRLCSSSSSMLNVKIDEKTEIAILEFNRPPVNSLSLEFSQEITRKIDELTKNRANGFIITSALDKVFCGGFDIQEMNKPDLNRAEKAWRALQEVWFKIYSSPLLTAAAINGHSPAGGCMMALACEHRVMLPNFRIGLNEVQLGLEVPEWLRATMRNVLSRRDTELALTLGTIFSTEDALKVGLIDELANSKEEAIEKCRNFMLQFEKIAPEARSRTKLGLRRAEIQDFLATREDDVQMFVRDIQKESFQEGIELYLKSLKKKRNN
ncbi:enoyl-CoA delta isomerase 1, mitochondrial-like [Culicoides brevitarsis]|uniref:enoyl-CoA delta isomerase 1, mitochondrial-like n=1 Tax=Culicoides brevitarsis TaxID=469753 RepID=UPI00307B67E8